MSDTPGVNEGYQKSSPWPIFVAFGLAISEVGVFVPLFPVAVGGLLLFAGSIAGILYESDTVADAWTTFGALGGGLAALGVGLYLYTGAPLTVDQLVVTVEVGTTPGGGSVAYRALAIVTAGLFAVVGSLVGRFAAFDRDWAAE
jgi:hypothetical protein